MKKIFIQVAFAGSMIIGQHLHAQGYDGSSQNFGSQYQCGNGIFEIGGDWLYWKAEEERLEFGALVQGVDVPGTSTIHSTVLRPKFKETNGYRVFADYQTNDRKWKIEACFSHVPSNAHIAVPTDPQGTSFISLFAVNFPLLNAVADLNFTSASSRWDLDVDYFDLDVSRNFTVFNGFEISPHIGIRGFWLDQKYDIFANSIPLNLAFTSKMKGKMEGAGVEGGLTGNLKLGMGFSILGHWGGSLVYTKCTNQGTLQAIAAPEIPTSINYSDKTNKGTAMMDSFLGIRYTNDSWKDHPISLLAGWEHHLVFDTNLFSLTNGANLSMQGLTLGGSIGF